MLTNIAAATQILANALKALDSLREQAKGSKDATLKENISKIYDSLLDLKAVVVRVQDENAALQRKIEQLAPPLPEKPSKRTPNIRCLGASTNYLRQGIHGNGWYDDPKHESQESVPGAVVCFRNEAQHGKDVAAVFDVRASVTFLDDSGQEMGTGITEACWLGDSGDIDFRLEENHCVVVLLVLRNKSLICPYKQYVTTSWGGGLRIDAYELFEAPKTIEIRLISKNDLLLPPCAFDVSMVDGRPILKQRPSKETSEAQRDGV